MSERDNPDDPRPVDTASEYAVWEEINSALPAAHDPLVMALLQNPTEDNVALAFAQMHAGDWAFLHGMKAWHYWTGTHWRRDSTDRVRELVRSLSRRMNQRGQTSPARASFVRGVLEHLQSDRDFARHVADFDTNTDLLNTPAGTYNLATLERHEHRQDDQITHITTVPPSPGKGERFSRFLEEITGGDPELAQFHQMSLGACLSGAIEGHWLLFWYGSRARNGKNTLGDLIAKIMGSYSGALPTAALMLNNHGDGHPTEIMNLRGRRLVVSSEVPDGSFWNEARLKETTGDSVLTGRYMRQDWIEFPRTHKHLIYGNHQPQLRNVDPAIQSRFKLVPFPVSFAGREDPDLPRKLWREADRVLWWLLEGHQLWRENGKKLPDCRAVDGATRDYFESQSTPEAWIAERCHEVSNRELPGRYWAKASVLYADYKEWKRERGEQPYSQTRWGCWMAERYLKAKAAGTRYAGIGLRDVHQ